MSDPRIQPGARVLDAHGFEFEVVGIGFDAEREHWHQERVVYRRVVDGRLLIAPKSSFLGTELRGGSFVSSFVLVEGQRGR